MKTVNFDKKILLLILLSLLPLINLLKPGLPITHDGQDHVARIANFYQSLAEGNIVPRWAGNLNWGYGHPILMFLYPLPSYLAVLFHLLGFSYVDSLKLVLAMTYVVSIVVMYVWLKVHFDKTASLVGALLYGFAPYRFVDMYVRGAIGEHVAFVFPPLILLALYHLAKNNNRVAVWFVMSALTTAGLILAHNAISMLFIPVIVFYICFLTYFESNRRSRFLFYCLASFIIGIGLSSFFLIPAYFEGKYTLRDIVTRGEFADRFVELKQFFYVPWNYGGTKELSKELGILQWISVILTIYFLIKENKKMYWLTVGSLLLLISSILMMTSVSAFIWNTLTILQKFQFPWRFLSLSAFTTSVLGAYVVMKLKFNSLKIVTLISLTLLITTNRMWKAKEYTVRPETFYSGIYSGTTDTGESSPIWSVRFMEKEPVVPIEIIDGAAEVEIGQRKTTLREYKIRAKVPTRLVENTLYFPGWNIYLDGIKTGIEFQDPNHRGLMTFWVSEGEHSVRVLFNDTKLRKLANAITLLSIVLLGGISLYAIWLKKRTKMI